MQTERVFDGSYVASRRRYGGSVSLQRWCSGIRSTPVSRICAVSPALPELPIVSEPDSTGRSQARAAVPVLVLMLSVITTSRPDGRAEPHSRTLGKWACLVRAIIEKEEAVARALPYWRRPFDQAPHGQMHVSSSPVEGNTPDSPQASVKDELPQVVSPLALVQLEYISMQSLPPPMGCSSRDGPVETTSSD